MPRSKKKTQPARHVSSVVVRVDDESKQFLEAAADLRHVAVSDYVRTVAVHQAKREVRAARKNVITLTAEEQLEFWTALNQPPKLTAAQRRLGSLMRGED
jgi:uncharacterized protein (DUF1778 family)